MTMHIGENKVKRSIAVLKITYHCLHLSELCLTLIRTLITLFGNITELYGTTEFYAAVF